MACVGHVTFETVSNFLYIYCTLYFYILSENKPTPSLGGEGKRYATKYIRGKNNELFRQLDFFFFKKKVSLILMT